MKNAEEIVLDANRYTSLEETVVVVVKHGLISVVCCDHHVLEVFISH